MHKHRSVVDLSDPMAFFKKLQTITAKINATSKIEEIMLDLSEDICELFGCDRLTLYALSQSRTHIESKVKTGLRSFKNFSLPISAASIAGFVALTRRVVNIADVYDEGELRALSPELTFMRDVDQRTGYRTRQIMAAPLVDEDGGALLGVVQLINNRNPGRFSPMIEDGLRDLCEVLSRVFAQRILPLLTVRMKYDPLVEIGLLSGAELAQAYRNARLKARDMQQILQEDFHLSLADIGAALATFFNTPYEPFRPERKPLALSLKKFRRPYCEHNRWLLLDDDGECIRILSTDPARVRNARVVESLFPHRRLEYLVSTDREFRLTLDQYFGGGPITEEAHAAGLSPAMSAAENALLTRLCGMLHKAAQDIPGLQLDVRTDLLRMVRRAADDGSLAGIRGQLSFDFSYELQPPAGAADSPSDYSH
ncbi:GAF domain-containing protein [Massilia sp. W12]|uniref:GAF domain-containing protein n=1 Tax=Massilia sp. W12 TaxID=3126507 RepID=UPI0030D5E1BA